MLPLLFRTGFKSAFERDFTIGIK